MVSDGLIATMRASARLHRATESLFSTLPKEKRTRHLAGEARDLAKALDHEADLLEAGYAPLPGDGGARSAEDDGTPA